MVQYVTFCVLPVVFVSDPLIASTAVWPAEQQKSGQSHNKRENNNASTLPIAVVAIGLPPPYLLSVLVPVVRVCSLFFEPGFFHQALQEEHPRIFPV